MPLILKFWHQWGWLFHISWALVLGTSLIVTYRDGIAQNNKDILALQQQHVDEHMEIRMVKQEQISQSISQDIAEIKMVQGKIFDRINTIADRGK